MFEGPVLRQMSCASSASSQSSLEMDGKSQSPSSPYDSQASFYSKTGFDSHVSRSTSQHHQDAKASLNSFSAPPNVAAPPARNMALVQSPVGAIAVRSESKIL